ncbi:MAG: helix-turn-helix domain-containing protein [Paracoccaceae bacterium]
MGEARRILFLGCEGVQTLDLAGPMEVFATANLEAGRAGHGGPLYEMVLLSPDDRPITSQAGLHLGPVVPRAAAGTADTLIVAGGSAAAVMGALAEPLFRDWLGAMPGRVRRVASICTGAFLLAAAGFLDGRRATTHWRSCRDLARLFPKVRVVPDAIFVADPPFYTSAGVTSGIDLSLAMVEADHGAELARAVARELVLFLRRPGGQSQFSAAQNLQAAAEPRIAALVRRLIEAPPAEGRVPALAEAAGMSERTFQRKFHAATGQTPARFVEEARLSRAKALLETSDLMLDRLAAEAGYGGRDGLYRAFQKHLGLTPGEYRARFR